ncbi:hypothetical protein [Parvularcula sp. IMCC14364]|uniref:hypothetical protein n=1 Tax=Parvularcula sp. IMCC14364 TaxID=3067902 RepID=UPI0027408A72|nr:hypothetical protein [Parvularcula sp. IMCC14364]
MSVNDETDFPAAEDDSNVHSLRTPVEGTEKNPEHTVGNFTRPSERWNRRAQLVQFGFRVAAFAFLGCFLFGWPLGTSLAEYNQTGLFRFRLGFTMPVFFYMVTIPILIYVIGHILSLGLRMAGKAEDLEFSAVSLLKPDVSAAQNIRIVGTAVRGQIDSLNVHLDEALGKLASVESMIRQQIKAIDSAAEAMQSASHDNTDKVASERQQLMQLTEKLNLEAEKFAEAIAEKARLGLESSETANSRIAGAEIDLENRLTRLEDTAAKALTAFESLADTMQEQESAVSRSTARLDSLASAADGKTSYLRHLLQENAENILEAQKRLEADGQRLEQLIQDQKDRAERLAETVAAQAEHNPELEKAFESLSMVEQMIRQQVETINTAASTIQTASSESASRIETERDQMIQMTEQLNQEAERFAESISRNAHSGLETRLGDLETVAQNALSAFEKLAGSIEAQEQAVTQSSARLETLTTQTSEKAGHLAAMLGENVTAIAQTQEGLNAENAKLEQMITDQRARVEQLATSINEQTENNPALSGAIDSLVSVETMLREQITAVSTTSGLLQDATGNNAERLVQEREQLMSLMQELNEEAGRFADTISENARTSADMASDDSRFAEAQAKLTTRIETLEAISSRALGAFDNLTTALAEKEGIISESAQRLDTISSRAGEQTDMIRQMLDDNTQVMTSVQERLQAEGQRLEAIIVSQQERADTLLTALSEKTGTGLFSTDALEKLDTVEQMIRQQITAMEHAATSVQTSSGEAATRIAEERSQLISLTESLNKEADRLVQAITEQSGLDRTDSDISLEAFGKAEQAIQSRLETLEQKAEQTLSAFSTVSEQLSSQENAVSTSAERIGKVKTDTAQQSAEMAKLIEANTSVLSEAQSRLAAESQKLEDMIQDQRERAERLASAIAEQTARMSELEQTQDSRARPMRRHDDQPARKPLSISSILALGDDTGKTADAPMLLKEDAAAAARDSAEVRRTRQEKSWRDILAAADVTDDPLTLERTAVKNTGTDKSTNPAGNSDAIGLVRKMQYFMRDIERQLYGEPQPAIISRFEGGERNIFAHIILRRDEEAVKDRIRLETSRRPAFRQDVYQFLETFDQLLEPATGEQDGDTLIDDYLGSPIGQVYLIVGNAMDYFS